MNVPRNAQESPIQPSTPTKTRNAEGPPSLDGLQQSFADVLSGQRACQWEAGDLAAQALAQCVDKVAKRAVLGTLAQLGMCSATYVQQMADVARTFPGRTRLPDVPWSFYRACRQAYGRNQRDFIDADALLGYALERGWNSKEVNALGKPAKEKTPCPTCGK